MGVGEGEGVFRNASSVSSAEDVIFFFGRDAEKRSRVTLPSTASLTPFASVAEGFPSVRTLQETGSTWIRDGCKALHKSDKLGVSKIFQLH